MQEFNERNNENNSRANAVQFKAPNNSEVSVSPPCLFSHSPRQHKNNDEQDAESTIEIKDSVAEATLPAPPLQLKQVENEPKEEGEEKGEVKVGRAYAGDGDTPPEKPLNSNSASVFALGPLQRKDKEAGLGNSKAPFPGSSAGVMQKMENSFGADFSNIKINTNSSAAKDAGALAFTQGNQIDFAPGQYNPQSTSGQELLGHELTHVVQQREGRVQPTGQVNGKPLNDDKGLEKEADVKGKMAAQASGTNSSESRSGNFTLASSPSTQFKLKMHSEAFAIQRQTAGEDTTPVDVDEVAIAKELISNGAKNENYITDEVFYKRYPGIKRRKLIFPKSTDSEKGLIRDWLRIRNETVRPLLRGEEIPDKDKPDNGKPKKDPKEKEKPKKDKPKEEDPEKEVPEKEKPDQKDPVSPDPIFELPDFPDISPETISVALDALKSLAELTRLVPGVGVFAGLLAGSIQMYQDLMTSIQTGDWILGGLTFLRNSVNLVNGLIGDVSHLITCLQDLGYVATTVSTATGPGVALAASIEGFIVFCNEISSIFNLILDLVMLVLDTLIIAWTTAKLAAAPMTDDERAAHKSLLVGYLGNGAADLISTFLDGLDVVSLGVLHGEFIDKFIKSYKGMSLLTKFGIKAIYKLNEIMVGIILPGEVNLLQAKSEGEEVEDDESGLEELLDTFVLTNQKFDLLDGGAKQLLDMWPTIVNQMEEKIEEMSDGREPFEVAKEMFDQALVDLEMKISSMTLIQDQLVIADSNILLGLEELEGVESMIDEISIPELEMADIDLGDNPIADGLEGVLEGAGDVVIETLNKAIRLANEQLETLKASLKEGIAGFKEELEFIRVVIEESQKVLSAHKEELRSFIDSTREKLDGCGSFEDLFNGLLGEMGKVLGIEEEIDVDTLREEWDSTKDAVAEGLRQIKEILASREAKSGSEESSADVSQSKIEAKEDPDSIDMASSSTLAIQKKTSETETSEQQENIQSAFQLKPDSNSPQEEAHENAPFQLMQNVNSNSTSKNHEHEVPFEL